MSDSLSANVHQTCQHHLQTEVQTLAIESSTDLPSAENNFCKDRHVWRQNGWHKWVVLCIYCPSCPPCCCKGSPTDLPSTGNIFQRHVSRPNWLTYMSSNSFPNRIGEKIVGFHVSSLKRIMFKVQFVCGLFSIFKKKTKTKRQTKEEDKGKLT